MPVVKVEARAGLNPEKKVAILDAIHEALVEAFGIPREDRAQRFVEYQAADFVIPGGRSNAFLLIEISAFSGRTPEKKRALFEGILVRFERLGIARNDVFVVLNEVPQENWGFGNTS